MSTPVSRNKREGWYYGRIHADILRYDCDVRGKKGSKHTRTHVNWQALSAHKKNRNTY